MRGTRATNHTHLEIRERDVREMGGVSAPTPRMAEHAWKLSRVHRVPSRRQGLCLSAQAPGTDVLDWKQQGGVWFWLVCSDHHSLRAVDLKR